MPLTKGKRWARRSPTRPEACASVNEALPKGSIADLEGRIADQRNARVWHQRSPSIKHQRLLIYGCERWQKHPDPGHMYEVNIRADPSHFLDWDKPLSEQPTR
jgi:hypothetical protein